MISAENVERGTQKEAAIGFQTNHCNKETFFPIIIKHLCVGYFLCSINMISVLSEKISCVLVKSIFFNPEVDSLVPKCFYCSLFCCISSIPLSILLIHILH